MSFERLAAGIVCISLLVLFGDVTISQAIAAEPSAAKIAPLAVLSDFAAIAAGIAVAYAGLPSFRYRQRVQEHVRRTIEEEKLIPLLTATETRQDFWGILFRLGKLREVKEAPVPIRAEPDIEVDHNFGKRPAYFFYSRLFASNLDKYTAVALGTVAVSIVWFSMLDSINYFEPTTLTLGRAQFLTTLELVYYCLSVIAIVTFCAHFTLWHWEMPNSCWQERWIGYAVNTACVLMTGLIVLASIGTADSAIYRISTYVGSNGQELVFFLLEKILLTTVALPVMMLIAGEFLTKRMIKEADVALKGLLGQIKNQPSKATLTPPGQ